MPYKVEPIELKAARAAHELFMVNLGALLLLGPLTIFLGIGRVALLIPVLFSAIFVFISYRKVKLSRSWFAQQHWRLALRNYRWLYIGYALTALLMLLSWGVELSTSADSPSQFLAMALIRIGVMPTIIMVFACFVVENGALNQALRHELPQRLVDAFPPPQDETAA